MVNILLYRNVRGMSFLSIMRDRDKVIDVLRFIAIFCIVIAHSAPNSIIFQLRNFDVILMVLIMGTSFYISQKDKKVSFRSYITKRFSRLILSTWRFLLLFFLVFYIISLVLQENYFFNLKIIIWSFLLNGGIGFVWIMYVFFIVAFFNPSLLALSKKINKNRNYFLLLGLSYFAYHLLIKMNSILPETLENLTENYILVPVGYCIIAAIGIRLKRLSRSEILSGIFLFFLIFIVLFIFHAHEGTQSFKYPPTIYYISYGLFVSFLLYFMLSYSLKIKLLFNSFVFFYSEKSLNLYFWHIVPFFIIEIYGDRIPRISDHFLSRFLFIISIGLVCTYLHGYLGKKWKFRSLHKNDFPFKGL